MRQSIVLPRVNLVERDLVAMSKIEKQADLSVSIINLFRSLVTCLCRNVCCLYVTDILLPFQTQTSGISERLHICIISNP